MFQKWTPWLGLKVSLAESKCPSPYPTGEIDRIELALNNVRAGGGAGDESLANALQKLTQAVLRDQAMSSEAREAALEALSYLSTQAALPQEERQKSLD